MLVPDEHSSTLEEVGADVESSTILGTGLPLDAGEFSPLAEEFCSSSPGFRKKVPMPFCHEGVGVHLTGLPPLVLSLAPGEPNTLLEEDPPPPPPPSCFRGALAATTVNNNNK